MSRHAKSECTLPSTLTAYGGSGCYSMASSSDGIAVAAATDDHVNIYPVCSIWVPCFSLPIPTEISEFNKKFHSRICKYPDCMYKLKYPKYVKPEDAAFRRKSGKKRNIYNGTIQMMNFHGENNEYLVGVGPFLFVIYDLRTMAIKPIICMDMRYFGVDAYSYPYQLHASLDIINIIRDFMYNNQKLSCVDFIFSVKPFVPTYFRVLFNEEKNWWVVDCRSTVAILSRDSLDEEVPYVFYNHDNTKLPKVDDDLYEFEMDEDDNDREDEMKNKNDFEKDEVNNNKYNNETYQDKEYKYRNEHNYDEQNEMNEFNNTLELVQKDMDVSNQFRSDQGFYNSSADDGDVEMNLDISNTRLSSVFNNRNRMDSENIENFDNMENEKTGDTTPINYDSENYESDNNETNQDNNNSDDQEESRNSESDNQDGYYTNKFNSLTNSDYNTNSPNTSTSSGSRYKRHHNFYSNNYVNYYNNLSQMLSKAIFNGVYHPFCILEKKVDLPRSKINELAKKMKEGKLSYNQEFLIATFVPLGTVVMIKFSVENRFYIKNSRVQHSQLLGTSSKILTDLVISHLVSRVHTFSARRHGRVFTMILNEKFYVLKYTAPTVVSLNMIVEGEADEERDKKESEYPNIEMDDKNKDDNVSNNYRICYVDDDADYSIYTHFSHYDPVLKLHYTVASFDLSKSDGYMAICTNYSSQWGLQIFSLASQTGIDGLRLVLDSSKCKGFSHISWLPYSKKLLAVSRINGELFQLEPKTQRNWVGLISNFTCIDKNVEYIESEDAFDIGPDGEMTSPIIVKKEFSLSKKDPTKDEKYKGLGWKRDSYRYPFFHIGFSTVGNMWFRNKQGVKTSEEVPLYHIEDQEVKEKYMRWLKSSKLL